MRHILTFLNRTTLRQYTVKAMHAHMEQKQMEHYNTESKTTGERKGKESKKKKKGQTNSPKSEREISNTCNKDVTASRGERNRCSKQGRKYKQDCLDIWPKQLDLNIKHDVRSRLDMMYRTSHMKTAKRPFFMIISLLKNKDEKLQRTQSTKSYKGPKLTNAA